jgi:hypothetical protein
LSYDTPSSNGHRPAREVRRIGLWGAPTSGKTSFLAALSIAVAQTRRNWQLYGVNKTSVDFLTTNTHILTHERRFPAATQNVDELSWVLTTEIERTFPRKWRRTEIRKVPLELHLDLLDPPGAFFDSVPDTASSPGPAKELGFDDEPGEVLQSAEDKLIENLADCDGIIYLFDPIQEHKDGNSFQYFQRTLAELNQRAMESGTLERNRLRQHLAVCVTKFDEPRVFLTAKKKRYLTVDPDDDRMFPRVHFEDAEHLFEDLCKISPTGGGTLVHDNIRTYFREHKVRYFATSAIGFYLARSSVRFRIADYQNAVPDGTGDHRIRGDIHPINVLEPLLWLGQQISGTTEF